MNTFRSFFPFFSAELKSDQVAWLDNGASTQKPLSTIETESNIYKKNYANIHRGMYALSEKMTTKYEAARKSVAEWINAISNEIVFTSGTTAGINLVATYWGPHFVKKGDQIIITEVEHHANFLPWQRLAQQTEAELVVIPLNKKTWTLDTSAIKLSPRVKILAITHYSNVLGNIWDTKKNQLEDLVAQAQKNGTFVLLDAAQSAPHKKLDVKKLPVDAAAFSGHKMCASTGIGVLYINQKWHSILPPFFLGGSMVRSASLEKSEWMEAPLKFEAGTTPFVQAISLGKTIDFLTEQMTDVARKKLKEQIQLLISELQKIPQLILLGDLQKLVDGSLVTFYVPQIHAHDIAAFLAEDQITVRAGHHCAQPLFQSLAIDSSVRISLYYYNTDEEIMRCINSLKKCITLLT